MDRGQCLDRLILQHDCFLYQHVDAIARVDHQAIVVDRESDLAADRHTTSAELVGATGLVGGLQQAWPQGTVYCVHRIDDDGGEALKLFSILPQRMLRALRAFAVIIFRRKGAKNTKAALAVAGFSCDRAKKGDSARLAPTA